MTIIKYRKGEGFEHFYTKLQEAFQQITGNIFSAQNFSVFIG
jgi:hypothetical protein